MKRIPLIAAKPMRYGTRRLCAGDTFEAARQDARVLVAVGLATGSDPAPRFTVRQVTKHDATLPSESIASETPAIAEEIAGSLFPETADSDTRLEAGDDLGGLRAEYETRTGRTADRRWGVARLKAEIEGGQ